MKLKKEKKELTPKQQKTRNILNWVVNIASIIIVVFALVFAILTIVRVTNDNGITSIGGKVYMGVMSDSMKPSFSKGDVIIANEFNGDLSSLKLGQVITFKVGEGQTSYFNTHRIVKIANGGVYTRGDNQDGDWHDRLDLPVEEYRTSPTNEVEWVRLDKIVAVWGSVKEVDDQIVFTPGKVLKGAGLFSNWLHEPGKERVRFFCIIVLPLIVLFVAYAFVLVRTLVIAKLENERKVQADTTVTVDSLSDEEKRRLAEEYLASLKAAESDAKPSDPPADEKPEVAPADEQPADDKADVSDSPETL